MRAWVPVLPPCHHASRLPPACLARTTTTPLTPLFPTGTDRRPRAPAVVGQRRRRTQTPNPRMPAAVVVADKRPATRRGRFATGAAARRQQRRLPTRGPAAAGPWTALRHRHRRAAAAAAGLALQWPQHPVKVQVTQAATRRPEKGAGATPPPRRWSSRPAWAVVATQAAGQRQQRYRGRQRLRPSREERQRHAAVMAASIASRRGRAGVTTRRPRDCAPLLQVLLPSLVAGQWTFATTACATGMRLARDATHHPGMELQPTLRRRRPTG
jgi:hypothetical protein